MPQPIKTDRPSEIHTTLPSSLVARIYAVLWSEVEGRVPRGAMQGFLRRAAEDLLITLENERVRNPGTSSSGS